MFLRKKEKKSGREKKEGEGKEGKGRRRGRKKEEEKEWTGQGVIAFGVDDRDSIRNMQRKLNRSGRNEGC